MTAVLESEAHRGRDGMAGWKTGLMRKKLTFVKTIRRLASFAFDLLKHPF
jgi:hypothetical protein